MSNNNRSNTGYANISILKRGKHVKLRLSILITVDEVQNRIIRYYDINSIDGYKIALETAILTKCNILNMTIPFMIDAGIGLRYLHNTLPDTHSVIINNPLSYAMGGNIIYVKNPTSPAKALAAKELGISRKAIYG